MPTISEAQVKKAIQDHLNKLKKQGKLMYFRLQGGKIQTINKSWVHLGEEGLPDLFVLPKDKKPFGLELKKPKGKHREAQENMKLFFESLGYCYYFADSIDQAKNIIETQAL